MAAANPQLTSIACPGCGAQYDFPAAMAGRSGRCTSCGTAFSVPALESTPPSKQAFAVSIFEEDDQPSQPQHVAVVCRVCQTRMYGRLDQVGQKLKCPDCGARNEVPPPAKEKPKNIPAALEGDQYELWEPDVQPSALAAAQPKYIAVKCRKCETLMYAAESQIGQTIACPDCNTKHIVPTPPKPKPVRSVLASSAETPALDPAFAPTERPPVLSAEELRRIDVQSRPVSEFGDQLDVRGRAVVPRWPLVQGILSFPFYAGCRVRWAALAVAMTAWLAMMIDSVPTWAGWNGGAAAGMYVIAALVQTAIAAILAILWLAAGSNVFIAIVSESSDGHNHISNWPPMNFIDSMSEMLPVSVAIMFSAMPGWALGQLVATEPWQLGLATLATAWLIFPITLLSQLSASSTWDLIELRVLSGIVRCPLSMMLFYAESALLAAICVGATVAAFQFDRYLPLALTPLYVACAFVYARLLGRLAWKLAEAMPEPADEQVAE